MKNDWGNDLQFRDSLMKNITTNMPKDMLHHVEQERQQF